MTPDEILARMRGRYDELAAVLRDLEARAQAVRGGMAEIDYLLAQFAETRAAREAFPERPETIERLPPSPLSALAFPLDSL